MWIDSGQFEPALMRFSEMLIERYGEAKACEILYISYKAIVNNDGGAKNDNFKAVPVLRGEGEKA